MNDYDINKIKRDNLNRLLEEKGIRSFELANLIKVGSSHVSRLRSGRASIGNNTLNKLCKVLGVDKQEFFKTPEISDNSANTHINSIYEAEHHRLILRFNNKKWGLDTNRLLLEIERLDSSQLKIVQNLLRSFAETLREEKRDNSM